VYSVSNGTLHSNWQKQEKCKVRMSKALQTWQYEKDMEFLVSELFELLCDDTRVTSPNKLPTTGYSVDQESQLSR